jgi:hypothetical protein
MLGNDFELTAYKWLAKRSQLCDKKMKGMKGMKGKRNLDDCVEGLRRI